MKKLMIALALSLFVLSMSTSALAAPAIRSSTCTGETDVSQPDSSASQDDSTNAAFTNANALLSSLKTFGYSSGASESTRDCSGSGSVIIPSDYASLRDFLKSYGFYIPEDSTGDNGAQPDEETEEPSPAPGGSDTETPAPSDNGSETNPSDNIDNLSYEEQVVALVNEQRAANGLAPLTLSAELSDVARAKSQDMRDNNYFSHTSPTYGSPFDMLTTFGISYRAAGENIAMGYATPEAVVNAWMNSSGHRANILNSSYTQIGVGYVADGNYWTQLFTG